jgi:hypothetical protein
MKDGHFAISALRVNIVLKSIENFLQSVLLARLAMGNFPDVSIGSTAKESLDFENIKHVSLNFFAHY